MHFAYAKLIPMFGHFLTVFLNESFINNLCIYWNSIKKGGEFFGGG